MLPVFLDHVLHPLLSDDQFVTEVYHFDADGKERGVVFSEMVMRENGRDIATLTNQEVIDYHRKFYDANNITVLLVGSFSDSFESVLQQLPADLVTSGGCDSRKPVECPEPVGDRWSEYIRFPSASADTGSFKFGWRGPMPDDAVAITALEILLRYLTEGYFESLLIQELQRLYDSKFDGNAGALSQAAKEYRQSFAMGLEDSPLQKLETTLIRDVTASHWSSSSEFRVGTYARVFDVIDELIQKPVDFWLDLLKRFIDTRVYYVAAVPDTELGKKLEQERRDIEQRNAQSISDKDRHTRRIERAVEASKLSIPDELKRSIHIPDAQKISSLPHVHEVVELATPIGPAAVVQLIELETAFPALSLSIPLQNLPDSLFAYDGDISDTARRVSCTEFDRQLAATTVSKWAYIVPNTDIFYVYLKSTHENVDVASNLLVRALLFADFTAERTLTVAQKLLSNIANQKLLSDCMLNEITWHFSAQDPTNRSRWGVIKSLDSGDTRIVDQLNELQSYIANGMGGFWTFTFSSGQREKKMRSIDKLAQDWQDCFGRPFDEQLADLPGIDYYALEVLISVLQRSGGPLYNAIRSKGLGYTPSFWQDMVPGMLLFVVDRASDASKAILEMRALVSGVGEHWDKYITEFEIAMAKSEMVCRATDSECSPHLQTFYCYVSNILGFASASQYTVWKNAHISAVKDADLRRVYDLYLKRFVTPGHPLLTVVLTPSGTEISAELGKFEVKMLDEL
ncbi:hypothetical protein DL89DRAFT_293904 [Linderina pennispora]|uniref:Peptidase M16 C-terminal domain-containing protein n=1 Tax=Linderina pennispora TaxID=61395 RepID=A0A1Y1W5L9_9FUNG|nr:uncharacterized protein DL89DRAFT_293904 [Linderina pennispora]ORX68692.1 hypothetical protein DL89DRAFT_293904 [Linderina pennispora]